MNNDLKGILGLCRRAGKMSLGHDAAVTSIKQRKAFLAITCSDASDRLKKEIADECGFDSRKTKFLTADFTMQDLGLVIGKKAPEVCPVCAHPQSYFEVRKENY